MIDLLKGKPTSVMSVKTEATYDEIMHAIHHNQIQTKPYVRWLTCVVLTPQSVFSSSIAPLATRYCLYLAASRYVWKWKGQSCKR